jgi:hypothetical protein
MGAIQINTKVLSMVFRSANESTTPTCKEECLNRNEFNQWIDLSSSRFMLYAGPDQKYAFHPACEVS